MEVVEDTAVAVAELHSLREEHWCVAVGVEGEDPVLHVLGNVEVAGLCHEPGEYFLSFIAEPFRMPLYSHDRLELTALDGFYDVVGSHCRYPEPRSSLSHGLMMERVDGDGAGAVQRVQYTSLRELHGMCRLGAVRVLTVLNLRSFLINILFHLTVEGYGKGLYSAADTEHRYLSVVCQTGDEQLR